MRDGEGGDPCCYRGSEGLCPMRRHHQHRMHGEGRSVSHSTPIFPPRRESTFIPLCAFVSLLLISTLIPKANVVVALNMSSPKPTMKPKLQIELFFKNRNELRQLVKFLSQTHGITSFNLVNKTNQDAVVISQSSRRCRMGSRSNSSWNA